MEIYESLVHMMVELALQYGPSGLPLLEEAERTAERGLEIVPTDTLVAALADVKTVTQLLRPDLKPQLGTAGSDS